MTTNDLVGVYEAGDEDTRMLSERNRVEWVRTLELLQRWLPPAPARVLDIGGASGRYAAWLTERGYQVRIVDPVPRHVRQATTRGLDAIVGDARDLPCHDNAVDVLLLLGPLYHLPSEQDRLRALTETVRCGVPGAIVVAAAMSRWAKPSVRAARGHLGDPAVRSHLLRVLAQGHDPQGDAFDLISFNHDPDQLRAEMLQAGLADVAVVGVEGPLGAAAREDVSLVDTALTAARLAEQQAPHLSIHLLARGVIDKPAGTPTR